MPNLEDMFARLSIAKFFTKIDLLSGYWKIVMARTLRSTQLSLTLLAIVWTLSFGLTGVPMAFTKLMRKLTWGRQDIVSYFNGMFHTTLDEHISGIQSMLQTIIKFGLKVILSKTFVSFKEVTCFWISDKAG